MPQFNFDKKCRTVQHRENEREKFSFSSEMYKVNGRNCLRLCEFQSTEKSPLLILMSVENAKHLEHLLCCCSLFFLRMACVCECVAYFFLVYSNSQRRVISKVKRKEIPWFFALWIRTVNFGDWATITAAAVPTAPAVAATGGKADLILSLSFFIAFHVPSFQFDCSSTTQKAVAWIHFVIGAYKI